MNDGDDARTFVLTGANGFIGRRVLGLLAGRLGRVWTITRQPIAPGVQFPAMVTNVVVAGAEAPVLPEGRFTLVHVAWCKPVRQVWTPHVEQIAALARLLEMAGDRVDRVVALGSAEEYGAAEGALAEESPVTGLLSPYGWGKQAARQLVQSWSGRTARPAIWLRPFTVYGEGQQGDMALAYAVRMFAAGGAARFSDGRQRRDFVHVDDVARGVVAAVDSIRPGFHAVNLGTGVATPLADVLMRLATLFSAQESLQLGALPRRAGEPAAQWADVSAARRELGWEAKISLDAGLPRLYESRFR